MFKSTLGLLILMIAQAGSASAATYLQSKNNLCLDVKDGGTADGTPVQLYTCTQGNTNQQWTFVNGALRATNGKCLDIKDNRQGDGSALQLWSCTGGRNQAWQLQDGLLINTASNQCVDVTDGLMVNGTLLQTWTCYKSSPNQTWVATTTAGTGQSAQPSAASGYLQARGTRIVDPSGKEVLLRGTNIGGWLVTEGWMNGYSDDSDKNPFRFSLETLERRFGAQKADELINVWRDKFFTADDLDVIASLGLNVIRVPFGWRNLQRADGSWVKDKDGRIDLSRLEWVVAEAAKRRIYTILDFHIWQGQQQNYDTISQNSDAGRAAQAQAAAIWTQVARRFKGNPWVAGFDAINEPTGSYANLMQDALYKAIRAQDQDRIIFMESMGADPASLGWKQVSYSIHQYTMMGGDFGENQRNFWASFNSDVQNFNRFNIPTYIGEFMCQKEGQTLAWVLSQYQQQRLHYTNWTYKTVDMGAWGLCNLPGSARVDILRDSADRIKQVWQGLGRCTPVDGTVQAFKSAPR